MPIPITTIVAFKISGNVTQAEDRFRFETFSGNVMSKKKFSGNATLPSPDHDALILFAPPQYEVVELVGITVHLQQDDNFVFKQSKT